MSSTLGAATRESLLETQAQARSRPRAPELVGRPISAQMRGMEVYVEPAVARAECGSGVRLVNNAAAFASTFWRSSLWAFTCLGLALADGPWRMGPGGCPPSWLGMGQQGDGGVGAGREQGWAPLQTIRREKTNKPSSIKIESKGQ